MDLEAPVDAWYVWLGVTLVSVGLAGVVVGLPSEPPPDAERVAGALDRVGASEHDAAASLDHDAEAIRIDSERIAMRSDGGTARARVSFGPVVPVHTLDLNATERRALDGFLAGERLLPPLEATLAAGVADLRTETGEWYPADGTVRARGASVAGQRVVLVSV